MLGPELTLEAWGSPMAGYAGTSADTASNVFLTDHSCDLGRQGRGGHGSDRQRENSLFPPPHV